jgi:hypothetical protein
MRTDAHTQTTDQAVPAREDLDDVTCYEDDGCLVVCEKANASAWIRSDVTTDVTP